MGSKGAEPNKAKEKYNHTNQNEEVVFFTEEERRVT